MRLILAVLMCFLSMPAMAAAWSPPATIDPGTLGPATFNDSFDTLDAGPDYNAKAQPLHRWRTVTKACSSWFNAAAPTLHDCRTGGAEGVYADRSVGIDPFRIASGKLVIEARPLPAEIAARWGRGYSTGWLSTKFSFAQRYGYFEMKALLPEGKGLWPAFWLMPVTGTWPANGEIDVMESLGVDGIYYASLHAKPGGKKSSVTTTVKRSNLSLTRAYHTYGVAWTPTEIVYYFDRQAVVRRPTPADVHQPMFLILNLATGGKWPGKMTVPTGRFVIERVSVWKLP